MHAGHGSGTKSQHLRLLAMVVPTRLDPAVHMNVAALRRKVASHSRVDKQQLQLAWFEPILAELACHGCEDPSCSCLGPELGHCIAVVVVFLQRRERPGPLEVWARRSHPCKVFVYSALSALSGASLVTG